MANFVPQGKILIGRVPFDNSYRHTMTFADAEAQRSYFASVCTQALSRSDYSYVRMGSAIRVPFNAEKLYTYNYCMYQNANYGTKWFYAFITAINYVNENTTELVLELDVMQTWYFDYQLKECFVEREHVSDDSRYKHTVPEPAMSVEYENSGYTEEIYSQDYIIVQTNSYPHYSTTGTQAMGSDPVSGDVYDDVYSACKFIVYRNDADGIKALKQDMDAWNGVGAAAGISNIFTCPSVFIQGKYEKLQVDGALSIPANVYQFKGGIDPNTVVKTFNQNTDFNGYVPHNNKLFSYPYSYCEMGDFSGKAQDWRYEFRGDNDLVYTIYAPVNSEMMGIIRMNDYEGNGEEASKEVFTFDLSNKCPWVYSAYQEWCAQNGLANQLSVIGSVSSIGFSLMPGLNAAAGALGSGISAQQMLPGMEKYGSKPASPLEIMAQNVSGQGLAAGALGLGATFANIDRMSKVPNTSKGNITGNSRIGSKTYGYYVTNVQLRREYAEIVDGFFDMFGYEVDSVKVPNRTGRKAWNYVKTRNACHRGNVPAPDMARINSIFDNGITFWHTSDVGNYSLDNTL